MSLLARRSYLLLRSLYVLWQKIFMRLDTVQCEKVLAVRGSGSSRSSDEVNKSTSNVSKVVVKCCFSWDEWWQWFHQQASDSRNYHAYLNTTKERSNLVHISVDELILRCFEHFSFLDDKVSLFSATVRMKWSTGTLAASHCEKQVYSGRLNSVDWTTGMDYWTGLLE